MPYGTKVYARTANKQQHAHGGISLARKYGEVGNFSPPHPYSLSQVPVVQHAAPTYTESSNHGGESGRLAYIVAMPTSTHSFMYQSLRPCHASVTFISSPNREL